MACAEKIIVRLAALAAVAIFLRATAGGHRRQRALAKFAPSIRLNRATPGRIGDGSMTTQDQETVGCVLTNAAPPRPAGHHRRRPAHRGAGTPQLESGHRHAGGMNRTYKVVVDPE
jgi:hypothetical protein